MKRAAVILSFVLVGAALAVAASSARRGLVITYSDGHSQTVTLERGADMIESLHFAEASQASAASGDFSGQWDLRLEDKTYNYFYAYDAVLRPASEQTWRVEETLRDTNHSFHHTRIGQSDTDCQVKFEQEKTVMICDGVDPNPSGLGKYHAEYEGSKGSDGVIRLNGRANGKLNVSFIVEMRRK